MNKLISHQVYICAAFVLQNLLLDKYCSCIAKNIIISYTINQVVITFYEVFWNTSVYKMQYIRKLLSD